MLVVQPQRRCLQEGREIFTDMRICSSNLLESSCASGTSNLRGRSFPTFTSS